MSVSKRTAIVSLIATIIALGAVHAQSLGTIVVEKPFSRATPGGARVGVGYLTIINKGTTADRLVSATSPSAEKVEIHEMKMDDGVMKMRELAGGVPIEPGKRSMLAPGGNHLMLMGLKAPLKEGEKVPVTLTFEKAGKVDVALDVMGIGAQSPGDAAMPPPSGGHMHKM